MNYNYLLNESKLWFTLMITYTQILVVHKFIGNTKSIGIK